MEDGDLPVRGPRDAAELVRLVGGDYAHPVRRRRVVLPLVLFLATCASTLWTGAVGWIPELCLGRFGHTEQSLRRQLQEQLVGEVPPEVVPEPQPDWSRGLIYMVAVVGILLMHEMGHFLTALRHSIPASLPFFIPVPILPFGTMGAVIGMRASQATRRQLFDLGIAGPLAGLAVALPIAWIGIQQLDCAAAAASAALPHGPLDFKLHNPLVFRLLIDYLRPDLPSDSALYISQYNPLLMAGWVGMLVTGLNMVPVSQLDGGHVAYGLLGRGAHLLARCLVIAAVAWIVVFEAYVWVLMLTLVVLMGVDHPPAAEGRTSLGWPRRLLGWASLAIPLLCLPPMKMT